MDYTVDESYNESLLTTPQPRACSTVTNSSDLLELRQQYSRQTRDDSLGILELNDLSVASSSVVRQRLALGNGIQIGSNLNTSGVHDFLRLSREKAIASMERRTNTCKSHFHNTYQSPSESTVFETDLLRQSRAQIGTPSSRFSLPNGSKTNMSDDLRGLSDKVRNTNMSIHEIFDKYKVTNSTFNDDVEFDSAMFIPAELAAEQMNADERSWRKQHDLPGTQQVSEFTMPDVTQCEKMSMGQFFAGKSDHCTSMFDKRSPEKHYPMPLVDSSLQDVSNMSNSNSYMAGPMSQMHDMLVNGNASPDQLLQFLKGYQQSRPLRNNSTSTSAVLQNSKQFHSTNNLTMNEDFSNPSLINSQSMQCLSESNKENHPRIANNRSLSSIRSTSSLDTLPDGKLPIDCTKTELIWGCVKLGTAQSQSFVLRNKLSNRMRFQMSFSNPSFKIANIDTDAQSTSVIVLHPNESRKFSITFRPLTIGAHVGKLLFYPILQGELQKNQRQILMMYGYEGSAKLELDELFKDPTGKMWLSLGKIESEESLTNTFIVKNSGNLAGFAWFSSISKILGLFTDIRIEPSVVVLKPGEKRMISVTYTVSNQDVRHLRANSNCGVGVLEIAQIKMVSGPEVIRGRLRRLSRRLKKDNLEVENVVEYLSKPFQNEIMPQDLKYFKETVGAFKELRHHLSDKDVLLTIERDLDKTIVPGMGLYDTSMFHTLTSNHSNATTLETTVNNKSILNCLTVEPVKILLTPPLKVTDSILFSSMNRDVVKYEIKLEPEGWINVDELDGVIAPGEIKIITVSCAKKQYNETCQVRVVILADNDVLDVIVKVINLL